MTNYAAAPIQPIAHALITAFGVAGNFANQKGFTANYTYNGVGDYTLTLDPGLPGDVTVEADGTVNDQPRIFLTIRSGSTFLTTIDQKSVQYIPSSVPNTGVNQIRIRLAVGGVATDPTGSNGGGLEIVVFRAAGATVYSQLFVGPLFQPVRTLP